MQISFDKNLKLISQKVGTNERLTFEEGESSFGAFVSDLPGCIAVGETESEVRQLIQEAIEFHLEDLQESSVSIPKPLSKSEYVEVLTA